MKSAEHYVDEEMDEYEFRIQKQRELIDSLTDENLRLIRRRQDAENERDAAVARANELEKHCCTAASYDIRNVRARADRAENEAADMRRARDIYGEAVNRLETEAAQLRVDLDRAEARIRVLDAVVCSECKTENCSKASHRIRELNAKVATLTAERDAAIARADELAGAIAGHRLAIKSACDRAERAEAEVRNLRKVADAARTALLPHRCHECGKSVGRALTLFRYPCGHDEATGGLEAVYEALSALDSGPADREGET